MLLLGVVGYGYVAVVVHCCCDLVVVNKGVVLIDAGWVCVCCGRFCFCVLCWCDVVMFLVGVSACWYLIVV